MSLGVGQSATLNKLTQKDPVRLVWDKMVDVIDTLTSTLQEVLDHRRHVLQDEVPNCAAPHLEEMSSLRDSFDRRGLPTATSFNADQPMRVAARDKPCVDKTVRRGDRTNYRSARSVAEQDGRASVIEVYNFRVHVGADN